MKQTLRLCSFLLCALFLACSGENTTTLADQNLPPDPGAAGNTTLEGIDSDQDGVRDDIQRYIVQAYPNQSEMQQAMFQVSKGYQAMILGSADKTTAYAANTQLTRSKNCLRVILNRDLDKVDDALDKLKAQVINTKERIKAYFSTDKLLSGGIFGDLPDEKSKTQCDF